jgi:stearoyl-CoA desaturase (delta-9 desaturase)
MELPQETPDDVVDGGGDQAPRASTVQLVATSAIVGIPLLGLIVAVIGPWSYGITLRDVILFAVFYAIVGHGVTTGFHRLFSHRSFVAVRPVKVALAIAGSMAFEGGLISWVDNHRRHHAFSDRPGDPHTPSESKGPLRGLWHAHVGWLFRAAPSDGARTNDLRCDHDLVVVDRLFPLWCVASLALPFGLGWFLGGFSLATGLSALLWAGLARICLLHHVTWSINSVCHMFGRRPYDTPDNSTDFRPLALLSMGESWHNSHHASPRAARHGRAPGQRDSSAALIHGLELLGWATAVQTGRTTERSRVSNRT